MGIIELVAILNITAEIIKQAVKLYIFGHYTQAELIQLALIL